MRRTAETATGLDEAWAAMEHSLSGHWGFDGLLPYPRLGEGWLARAKTDTACRCCGRGRVEYGHGFGATPEAALRDLAKKQLGPSA